jgi:hypothetical protein
MGISHGGTVVWTLVERLPWAAAMIGPPLSSAVA